MASEPTVGVEARPATAVGGPAEPVLALHDVGKAYRIYGRPQQRLKQMMLGRFGWSWGREFWALRGVSFDLLPGEALGIIGRNGSGKSTLLQMIAGILTPTTGEVRARGRVAALLELGSGFNPEFTGRENVFLSGAIMGIPRAAMDARIDDILAFADIGEFVDQPVKLYSSGMFMRLAFAVATSVQPNVLLIDEALAVGDVFFRQKCYGRLAQLRERGVSVILVSHAVTEIEQFCERALLLQRGNVEFLGPAREAVKRYYFLEQLDREPMQTEQPERSAAESPFRAADPPGLGWPRAEALLDISGVSQVSNGSARCTAVALCNVDGGACRTFSQGEIAVFFYEFELLRDVDVPIGGVVLHNDKGLNVHGKNTLQYGSDVPRRVPRGQRLRFRQEIALELAVGEYTFELGLAALSREDYERQALYSHDELRAKIIRLCLLPAVASVAIVFPRTRQLLHHGIANLRGTCAVSVSAPDQPA